MGRTIIIEEGQSLQDICAQESLPLPAICDLNDLEYDADLLSGQILTLPDYDPDNATQQYFADNNIGVNSHLAAKEVEVLGTNDDEVIGTNDNQGIQI